MIYIQESLGPDEELVHVGQFHWLFTLGAFISVIWGFVMCFAMLFGAQVLYKKMGWFPNELGWVEGVRYLHYTIKLGAFGILLFGVLGYMTQMMIRASTEIAITNKRVVFKQGLIARRVGEMSIDRIEGVNVLQTFWGRMLDYGQLAIRGMGVGEVILPPISAPLVFRRAIEKARSL